ncbi:hypothetical protein BpHYR1_018469 [Brachionus plicatilis]|uniref:Uncharacterized protein n=1 Tax=Brachionus plicatilis TaxID=10195 RepID=A0A3M7Q2F3_BRAPC|nr:hypothetical protein BpHYR1_018469 [Brachionus plicatilis]
MYIIQLKVNRFVQYWLIIILKKSELGLNVEDNIFPNNSPFSSAILKSSMACLIGVIEGYGSFDWKMKYIRWVI